MAKVIPFKKSIIPKKRRVLKTNSSLLKTRIGKYKFYKISITLPHLTPSLDEYSKQFADIKKDLCSKFI